MGNDRSLLNVSFGDYKRVGKGASFKQYFLTYAAGKMADAVNSFNELKLFHGRIVKKTLIGFRPAFKLVFSI